MHVTVSVYFLRRRAILHIWISECSVINNNLNPLIQIFYILCKNCFYGICFLCRSTLFFVANQSNLTGRDGLQLYISLFRSWLSCLASTRLQPQYSKYLERLLTNYRRMTGILSRLSVCCATSQSNYFFYVRTNIFSYWL